MAKKVVGYIKLQIEGGKATAAPPVGPALGQRGVNIMAFVKEFNARTANMTGILLPVVITVFSDKSFAFIVKKPPVTTLIKMKLKLDKGSKTPGKASSGVLTHAQVKEIATEKMPDLNCYDVDAAARLVEGSARSMGVRVES